MLPSDRIEFGMQGDDLRVNLLPLLALLSKLNRTADGRVWWSTGERWQPGAYKPAQPALKPLRVLGNRFCKRLPQTADEPPGFGL